MSLFEGRDPGIYSKKGARCGIFIVNGTRESVILRGGIRESITSTLQEPGSPLTRIYEETDLRESPKKPSHATASWDRVSIPPTNVFNLMSRMTIHVENIHSLVHLLQRSTLHGVKLRKKLWKCSQRRLKPSGWPIILQIQSLGVLYPNVPRSCLTGIQMLSPVPIAPQNIQKKRD